MKHLKIGLGLLTVMVGAASSAFKPVQQAFTNTAYFAPTENGVTGLGTTTSGTDGSQFTTWVKATAPSSSSTKIVGDCLIASNTFCAAQFTVTSAGSHVKSNNTILAVVTGEYVYEIV